MRASFITEESYAWATTGSGIGDEDVAGQAATEFLHQANCPVTVGCSRLKLDEADLLGDHAAARDRRPCVDVEAINGQDKLPCRAALEVAAVDERRRWWGD